MPRAAHPQWSQLYEVAAAQDGYFTTKQAAAAGFSPELLIHHHRTGKVMRFRRGIHRIVHFPPGEHEELVAAWLWSDRVGIVSHETALALHRLSDVLPAEVHLTVPSAWRRRRLRVPQGIVLHHQDVPASDRTWFGAVPVTTPRRALSDCALQGLSPELLRQAANQALRRGLTTRDDLAEVDRALRPFGGLAG